MTSGSFDNLPMDQPQGLCDIVGLACRIWRRNLGLIFRVLLLPTILLFGSTTVMQVCLQFGVKSANDFPKTIAYAGAGFAALLFYLAALLLFSSRLMALVRLFTGFSPDWDKARAFAAKRLPWLVGIGLISLLLWGVIVLIFCCIIGLSTFLMTLPTAGPILGAVGMFIGFVGVTLTVTMAILFGLMSFNVMACEETTFFGVVGRTFHWLGKYFGRVICFGFIFYVVLTAVSVPVSLPIVIATMVDGAVQASQGAMTNSPGEYHVSIPALIFIQVWEAICGLLLRPLSVLSFGLFYLDLRQRSDGLDLSRKLRILKAEYIGAGDNGLQGR